MRINPIYKEMLSDVDNMLSDLDNMLSDLDNMLSDLECDENGDRGQRMTAI